MTKLKLLRTYFGHNMQRPSFLEKAVMLGKVDEKIRKGQPAGRLMDSVIMAVSTLLGDLKEQAKDRSLGETLTYVIARNQK